MNQEKKPIDKYFDGDSLTDSEVDYLLYVFSTVSHGLSLLDKRYFLAYSDAHRNMERLVDICKARREKRIQANNTDK